MHALFVPYDYLKSFIIKEMGSKKGDDKPRGRSTFPLLDLLVLLSKHFLQQIRRSLIDIGANTFFLLLNQSKYAI